MTVLLEETIYWFLAIMEEGSSLTIWDLLGRIPMFVQFEMLINLMVLVGVLCWWIAKRAKVNAPPPAYHPGVSCIVTCYGEGNDVILTIKSLAMQLYDGPIEIIPVVDGSVKNKHTWQAVLSQASFVKSRTNRILNPIGKPQRGGRVSSLNTGLRIAKYDFIMVFDGDTSFTNDTVRLCAGHFHDPKCVAVSGNLRIRNAYLSLATRMQALEYKIGIALGRTGLAEWGIINNVSGAFGCFRKSFLKHIGGWDTGTAEDLDLTTRIKGFFGRHPELRIEFEPHAIGFTDGPPDFWSLIGQRERWDGDLSYLYLRKFRWSFNPRILGWKNFLLYLLVGLVFQIVVPFLIWIYYIKMFILYPVPYVFAISIWIYLAYLLVGIFMWFMYLGTVTRYLKEDLRDLPLVFLQPLYSFALRVLMVPYTLKSIVFRTHLDSSMAPYWVLRKGRY